jgi:hypothetical protein
MVFLSGGTFILGPLSSITFLGIGVVVGLDSKTRLGVFGNLRRAALPFIILGDALGLKDFQIVIPSPCLVVSK